MMTIEERRAAEEAYAQLKRIGHAKEAVVEAARALAFHPEDEELLAELADAVGRLDQQVIR